MKEHPPGGKDRPPPADSAPFDLKDFYGIKVPDTLGLMHGNKKIISMGIEPTHLPALKKTFSKYGLKFTALDSVHDYKGRRNTYIISKKTEYLAAANEAYGKNRFDLVGLLLGYPSCCVEKHLSLVAREAPDDFVRRCAGAAKRFFWPINNILDFDGRMVGAKAAAASFAGHRQISLISHNPCSFACERSLKIAVTNLLHLRRHGSDPGREGEYSLLMKPVLYLDDFHFAILDGKAAGRSVSYGGLALSFGLKELREKLLEGDKVSVSGAELSVFKKGRRSYKAVLPAPPLLLPFDREAD